MYKILAKDRLNDTVTRMVIDAPAVARKAEAGQFIILRVDERGERIPLTVADYDRQAGTVTIIYQIVGGTTMKLDALQPGDCLHDFVGPLGRATETEGLKKVAVIGGGVGCAIAYPVAKKLHEQGAQVHAIVGFRNADLVILEKEFAAVSDRLKIMTDDGSYGEKGLVTNALKVSLGHAGDKGRNVDLHRAAAGAWLVLAAQAALGFVNGLFGRVAGGHLGKIAAAHLRFLRGHRVFLQGHIRHGYCTSLLSRWQAASRAFFSASR